MLFKSLHNYAEFRDLKDLYNRCIPAISNFEL